MYDFVKGKEGRHFESLKKIGELEKKYSVVFPEILNEYYFKYDGEKIDLAAITVNGYKCEVAKIVPIISEKMDFEVIADNDRADGFIPEEYYPIARDRGGDYYYWDAKTGEVYLVLVDDFENPFKVADTVEEFFVKLSDCKQKDSVDITKGKDL